MMNPFIERWNAKSPAFFIQLKKVAIKVGSSSAAVLVANASIGLNLNSVLISSLGYVVAACVAIAGTAQLTKEDKP